MKVPQTQVPQTQAATFQSVEDVRTQTQSEAIRLESEALEH